MPVTQEDLIIAVEANTKAATASLQTLEGRLDEVIAGLKGMTKESTEGRKALTEFGLSSIRLAALLSNVEKAAKVAAKGFKALFGEATFKQAADELNKVLQSIGTTLSEGMGADLGQGVVRGIQAIGKAFDEVRPQIVGGVREVSAFISGLIDALKSVDWEPILKGLSALGVAMLLAFSPQIVASLVAFVKALRAMNIETTIAAAKSIALGIAIVAFAAVIEVAYKKTDDFVELLKGSFLLSMKAIELQMKKLGLSAIKLFLDIAQAASDLPVIGDLAKKSVDSLSKTFTELSASTIDASKDFEQLGAKVKKVGSTILKGTITGDVVDQVVAFTKNLSDGMDKASAATVRFQAAFKPTLDMIKDAESAMKDLTKLVDDLAAKQGAAFASEADQLRLAASEQFRVITGLEKRIALGGKLSDTQKEQIDQARELVAANLGSALEADRLKVLKEVLEKNKELGLVLESGNALAFEGIKKRRDAELALIDLKQEQLARDGQINDELQVQLDKQRALIKQGASDARLKAILEIIEKNKELRVELQAFNTSQIGQLEAQLAAQTDILDEKILTLEADRKGNAEAIAALEQQRKLAEKITKERISAANVEFEDVAKAFKEIKNPINVAEIKAAFKNGIDADSIKKAFKDGFDFTSLSNALSRGFKYAKAAIVDAFQTGSEFIGDVFDFMGGEQINKFADVGEMIANMPDALMKAFGRLDSLVGRFLDAFPAAVEKLLGSLPKIVDRIVTALPRIVSAIADALPKLAASLADAIPKIVRALAEQAPKLLAAVIDAISTLISAIPEMLDGIFDNLPKIIQTFFAKIPEIFQALFKAIPTIIESFMDNIDEIVLAFVQGIIEAVGDIVISFVDEFLLGGGLERIIGSILRAIPRIIVALVQGFIRGIANFFKKLFGGKGISVPKVEVDTKQVTKAVQSMGRSLTGEASKLFAVLDVGDQDKRAQKMAEFKEQIEEYGDIAAEKIKGAWQWVIDRWNDFIASLKAAGGWIADRWHEVVAFFETIGGALATLWHGVWEFLQTVGGALATLWKGVWAFLKGIGEGLAALWKGTWEFLQTVGGALAKLWQNVWSALETIGGALATLWKGAWTFLETIGTKVAKFFTDAWTGLSTIGTKVAKFFTDAWDSLTTIGTKVAGFFTTAWTALTTIGTSVSGLFTKAWEGLSTIGTKVSGFFTTAWDKLTTIAKPITDAFSSVWEKLKPIADTFGGVGEKLKAAFETVKDLGNKIAEPIKSAFSGVGDFFKNIGGAFTKLFSGDFSGFKEKVMDAFKGAFSGITDVFKKVFGGIVDLLNKLKIPGAAVDFKVLGKNVHIDFWPEIDLIPGDISLGFAKGGDIPGVGGNDSAMVGWTPGEFAVTRSGLEQLGADMLKMSNAGKSVATASAPAPAPVQTFHINVKLEGGDENWVRQKLIPRIKDELRQASRRGEGLIAAQGLRPD